jgi:hypothetical protein
MALLRLISCAGQLLTCFAIAISYFSMWCAIQARANTTHIQEGRSGGPVAGAATSPFNAAASVSMAVWLFFEVWLANTSACPCPRRSLWLAD